MLHVSNNIETLLKVFATPLGSLREISADPKEEEKGQKKKKKKKLELIFIVFVNMKHWRRKKHNTGRS